MPGQQRLEMRPSDANLGLQKTRLEGLTTTTARQNAGSRTSRLNKPSNQHKPSRATSLLVGHPRLAARLAGTLAKTEKSSPSTLAALYVRNQMV
jgi:hypothetical protein